MLQEIILTVLFIGACAVLGNQINDLVRVVKEDESSGKKCLKNSWVAEQR